MTQKELSYVEDAIGHEEAIIKVCNETSKLLEAEELISYINEEVDKHNTIKEQLLNLLEEKSNG